MIQKNNGLNQQQVKQSREKYGENILTPPPRASIWKMFFSKFEDPIIRVLLFVTVLSLIISFTPFFMGEKSLEDCEFVESIGILLAVILATGIGFWFEYDANKRFDLLNLTQDDQHVKVKRDGLILQIPRREVVVGDLVYLEVGDEVPADGQLEEAMNLQIDESCLTGELLCSKTIDSTKFKKEATYPSNWVMRGTKLMEGRGAMIVAHVGDATEYGKIAQKSTELIQEETPLNKQLGTLAQKISKIGTFVAVSLFIVLFLRDYLTIPDFFSQPILIVFNHFLHYLMVAVTILVVSVPEGLPMSVTLSLALSVRRMLKENNLVRKMHACETMGASTVICTDKTGTLTQNLMQVKDMILSKETQSSSLELLYENMAVNSTAFLDFSGDKPKPVGNPTEGALLLWLHSQGVDYMQKRESLKILNQLSFSTERKYMGTVIDSKILNTRVVFIKGAPEVIINSLASHSEDEVIYQTLASYQDQAMRTLGFAFKVVDTEQQFEDVDLLVKQGGFVFLGLVAINDPVRDEVPAAVAMCLNAGIQIKIITGDTIRTAVAIAKQIGIWTDKDHEKHCISGVDFEALTEEEALLRIPFIKIMYRARPTDKQRMVNLLQKLGEIVAVTGDGTNDAPALNHAHCGLSMGTGTAVAKEASDITLLDDSFNSITTAVKWGRSLYQNIQRFILFQLTINVVALLIVLLGAIIGNEIPLTVTQMLWVNLIMDTFAAAALASLPPNTEVMQHKPRNNSNFIIPKTMLKAIVFTSVSFFVILIGLWYYFMDARGEVSPYNLSFFFTTFVMLQFWNLFNAKAFFGKKSAFQGLSKSYGFLVVVAIILVGQFVIVTFGGEVFRTLPLKFNDWVLIIGSTSIVLWVGEILRLIKRKRSNGSKLEFTNV